MAGVCTKATDDALLPKVIVQLEMVVVLAPATLKPYPLALILKLQLFAEMIFPSEVTYFTIAAVEVLPFTVKVALERYKFVAVLLNPDPELPKIIGASPLTVYVPPVILVTVGPEI